MLSKWPWAWQSQWALWREAYRTTATPLGLERLVGLVPATADSKSSWPITMSGEFAGSERANRLPSEHAIVPRVGHVHMVIDLVDDDRARTMIAGEIRRAGRKRIGSFVGKVRLTQHARSRGSGAAMPVHAMRVTTRHNSDIRSIRCSAELMASYLPLPGAPPAPSLFLGCIRP